VADSRTKGLVKGLFGTPPPDHELPDQPPALADPEAQRQALQVLILAQRTADEHVAAAQHQADNIRADARATSEQIVREAQTHADGARREASKALSDARATAEQIVRDAQSHAEGARRDAEKVLSDARARAEQTAMDAQATADEFERQAEQRYQDIIGSLPAKRAALQQQIEALQKFDRDYRSRLRTFMQSQLRALGGDEPPPHAEEEQPAADQTGAATVTAH
jgi:vacuolar-type H+-ATPase subunit E/Vma4